ncbi:UNVERIFIED_CONTAM: hypothetical protein FKN15_070205 [Acipenser sinensis]
MSLKLYSEQYSNSTKRKKEFAEMSKVNRIGSNRYRQQLYCFFFFLPEMQLVAQIASFV